MQGKQLQERVYGECMKVYLVYGDVHFACYGSDIHCFGAFKDKEKAEQARLQKEEEYYQQELKIKEGYRNIDGREDVEFKVMELEINKTTDLELGGYIE